MAKLRRREVGHGLQRRLREPYWQDLQVRRIRLPLADAELGGRARMRVGAVIAHVRAR